MENYIGNPSKSAHLLKTCGKAIRSYVDLEKVVNEKAKFCMSHNIIGCKSEIMKLIVKVSKDIGVSPKSTGINLQKPMKHIAPDILKLGQSVIRYRNAVSELIAEELFTTTEELAEADKIVLSFPEIIKDDTRIAKLRGKVFFALKQHADKMLKTKGDIDNINISTQRCIDKYNKEINKALLLPVLNRI